MNGTLASPAVALAKRVFPVPGGPVKMAPCENNKQRVKKNKTRTQSFSQSAVNKMTTHRLPRPLTLGILAPRSWYCFGFFRKLTNSIISSFASSQPATSLNFTSISSFRIFAVVSLTLKSPPIPRPGRPAPAGPRRSMNSRKPMMRTVGSMLSRNVLDRENKLQCHAHTKRSPVMMSALTRRSLWNKPLAGGSLPRCRARTAPSLGSAQTCPRCRYWTRCTVERHNFLFHHSPTPLKTVNVTNIMWSNTLIGTGSSHCVGDTSKFSFGQLFF